MVGTGRGGKSVPNKRKKREPDSARSGAKSAPPKSSKRTGGAVRHGKARALGFKGFVNLVKPPLPKVMPLVHMTDALGAREILTSGIIEPRLCRHFSALTGVDEKLSYFFYGRAGYRPKGSEPTKNSAKLPVALIIEFDRTQHPIKRIFPFDTGAAFEKMYAAFIHDRMKVPDFDLEGEIESAQKVVSAFFETNEGYLNDRPKSTLNLDAAEFEVGCYYNLLRNTADTGVDNRKSSIEVQFEKPIELSKSRLLAVVMPEALLDSSVFQGLLNSFSVTASPYIMTGGSTTEYDGVLIAESTKVLRRFL
jgi:hypothetical protein